MPTSTSRYNFFEPNFYFDKSDVLLLLLIQPPLLMLDMMNGGTLLPCRTRYLAGTRMSYTCWTNFSASMKGTLVRTSRLISWHLCSTNTRERSAYSHQMEVVSHCMTNRESSTGFYVDLVLVGLATFFVQLW
ncbi:unnamed protein product [Amoebophrya sp. A120]|nr:unnamed protein product [Amoebophrya sp. A120]|eukprot:GSA120T00004473001.1